MGIDDVVAHNIAINCTLLEIAAFSGCENTEGPK